MTHISETDLQSDCGAGDGGMGQRSALTTDWLTGLSERLRAEGDTERADRVLLLAWQAYDGQDVTPEMLADTRATQKVGRKIGGMVRQPDAAGSLSHAWR